ncbi:hypothetical protein A3K82_01395 [Candidatus Pacearchaeota archaeon RBG_19FT_COMBO_34_9]|nr:MAG: hypothetical protein A3K82_01395 [Candidatus Pacearchaeota archaeon RBG_19FT_COMBO_34_9]OGJ16922.1 MAG: hypothetical protein A3K74_02185 [Candidatus Pacearchaeota archaeon RBG_13_33_26]
MGKEIFYIDLHRTEVLGWEKEKSKLVVKAIIRGIKKGDEFPPVPVQRIKDRFFLGDGHHRAIGHYLANKPLKCELCRQIFHDYNPELDNSLFPIKETVLVKDEGEYEIYVKQDKNYR